MRVILLAVALAAGPAAAPDWPVSTPSAQGMDPAPLEAFDRELAAGTHGYVDAMLVIRNGRIVYEKSYDHAKDYAKLFAGKGEPGIYNYYDPGWHPFYKKTALHTMQSVTKSVTSALVGIAIARGELPGVDAKVMPYFAKYAIPPDPRRDRMTLADVLTMRTGIRWDEVTAEYTDSANSCEIMEGKEDWIRYVLEQPMAEEPGKTFVYNSGASQLLSFLLEKTTGRKADDYAKEHLFGPLGIASHWKRTPTACPTPRAASISSRGTSRRSAPSTSTMASGTAGASCRRSGWRPRRDRARARTTARSGTATSGGSCPRQPRAATPPGSPGAMAVSSSSSCRSSTSSRSSPAGTSTTSRRSIPGPFSLGCSPRSERHRDGGARRLT